MAKLTINDIFDSLKSIKKDISDVDTGEQLRMANILNNEIYELNKSIKPDDYVFEYDFITQAGEQRYDLPIDFGDIKALNCGLFELNNNKLGSQVQESYPGGDNGYYIGGEYILGVYTPSIYFTEGQNGNNIYRLRYIRELPELISLADELVLDKRFLELARNFVLKEYAIFDEDSEREQIADQRYRLTVKDYIKSARKTPSVYNI